MTHCVGIEHVAEIVDGGSLTPVPGTDEHVEGVVDLRGRTTAIVDPCELLDTERPRAGESVTDGGRSQHGVVVLDPETVDAESPTGWVVSDVNEVTDVADATLEATDLGDSSLLRRSLEQNDGFTLWLDPDELTA